MTDVNAPVTRVTVHHQGGGAPHDGTWADSAPYSVLIGPTRFTIQQAPFRSWATKGFNHVSYDICLSGDRMVHAVTDNELALIGQACAEARRRGWLATVATTFPHGTLHPPPAPYLSGSSPTDCPGILAIARWPQIVTATGQHNIEPPPQPRGDDVPADTDVVDAYSGPDGAWALEYGGGVRTLRGPFYGSYYTLPPADRNDPTRRFLTITAPTDGQPHGYSIVSVKGEPYTFHTPQ